MKYIKKAIQVDAVQWLKDGDHPNVVSMNTRSEFTWIVKDKCKHCGKSYTEHGWLPSQYGGKIICPREWIINEAGKLYVCRPEMFIKGYSKVVKRSK